MSKITRNNYESFFLDYAEGTLSKEECLAVELFLEENPDLALEMMEDLPTLKEESIIGEFKSLKRSLLWDEAEVSELLIDQLEASIDHKELSADRLHRLNQFASEFPKKTEGLKKLIFSSVATPTSSHLDEKVILELLQMPQGENSTKLIAAVEGDLSSVEMNALKAELAKDDVLSKEYELFKQTVQVPVAVGLSNEFKDSLRRKASRVIPLWVKSIAAVAAVVLFFMVTVVMNQTDPEIAKFSPRELEKQVPSGIETEESIRYESFADASSDRTEAEKMEALSTETSISNPVQIDRSESFDSGASVAAIGSSEPKKYMDKIQPISIVAANEIAMSTNLSDKNIVAGSKQEVPEGTLSINTVDAEAFAYTPQEDTSVTPIQFVTSKIKDRVSDNEDANLAFALVNNAAKKLSQNEEEFIAFEKESEESRGFKFKLGRLSVETVR